MRRILFTLEVPAGRGGMEVVAAKVACLFKTTQNVGVEFFMFDEGEDKGSSTDWVGGTKVTLSKSDIRNGKVRHCLNLWRLTNKIRCFKPDIIITLNTVVCLTSRRAIKLAGSKAKLVTWMHLPPAERYRPYYLKLADHHLAISKEIKKQLIDIGVDGKDIDVIFNPVTKSDTTITRPIQTKFLYIGRTHYEDQKRLKDMFEACALLEGEWSLDIVGDGNDKLVCQNYAQKLNIANNITWHGWKNNPWEYTINNIKEVSALLLTSDFEGFPLILLEALSHGIYCIASDCVSGPKEIIIPGVNGALYPPRDIEALRQAMQTVVSGAELPSHEIIKNSVEELYDEKFIAHIGEVLNKLN